MCGRYRRTTSEEELARRYHIPIPQQRDLPISWNIAPTQDVLTIRLHPETKQRTLDALRWGLIPNWAKDPKIAYKTINARVETVDTAPSYKQAFKKRRCLIPVDGFYECKKVPGGKIPYSISMKDDSPFVFAGLWEGWKDPANEEWLHTCTIITGEPNEFVREIHTRMPVILPEEHHEAWFSGEAGKEILVPFPADRMKAWPISARVNSPKNNDAEIIVPIEPQSMSRSENSPQLLSCIRKPGPKRLLDSGLGRSLCFLRQLLDNMSAQFFYLQFKFTPKIGHTVHRRFAVGVTSLNKLLGIRGFPSVCRVFGVSLAFSTAICSNRNSSKSDRCPTKPQSITYSSPHRATSGSSPDEIIGENRWDHRSLP